MKKIIKIALPLFLALCMMASIVPAVYSASLSDKIDQEQDKINAIDKNISQLRQDLAAKKEEQAKTEADIKKIEAEKELTFEKKALLDDAMESLLAEIEITEALIAQYEENITYKNKEIKATEEKLAVQKELFTEHLRKEYEQGSSKIKYLELLLTSQSIGDFLSNRHYVASTLDYENFLIKEIQHLSVTLETQKSDLERTLAEQSEYKKELEAKQLKVQELIEETEEYMAKIVADEKMYRELIESFESGKEDISKEIDKALAERENHVLTKEELEAQKKAEDDAAKKEDEIKNDPNSKISYDKNDYGTWAWPVDYKKGRWTSPFGTRDDPFGSSNTENHTGIDLALAAGNNIYAVDGGTVIIATEHYSYGNYVVILHDNGLQTLYAHASKLLVKKGDIVARGEVVALVGSTGRSTGNHLHFSVKRNGRWVNPMNFYPNLSKNLILYD